MKHIKSFNESIKNHLKPKTEDDIKKTLDGLTPSQKMKKIKQYDLIKLFTDDEIKNIQKQVDEEIKKVIESYKSSYNSDFFEHFVKLFPSMEKHNSVLNDYYENYFPNTGEELTEDDIHYVYDEYYNDAYKEMLNNEFEHIDLPTDDIDELFDICQDFTFRLENVGW